MQRLNSKYLILIVLIFFTVTINNLTVQTLYKCCQRNTLKKKTIQYIFFLSWRKKIAKSS